MGNRGAVIPVQLQRLDRWVCWRKAARAGRFTKLPIQLNGRNASSTDPVTWASYKEATHVKIGDGIGFVLGGGIGCVDLDHCLIDDGLTPGAEKVLAALPATYVEVSPSGDGLHVWLRMPASRGRVFDVAGQPVEVYPPDSGRYVTVTSKPYRGSRPKVAECDALKVLLAL